ncbi:hypothetical protein GC163_24565 [bacterium]|nr:hypothetical protein [bacterium]
MTETVGPEPEKCGSSGNANSRIEGKPITDAKLENQQKVSLQPEHHDISQPLPSQLAAALVEATSGSEWDVLNAKLIDNVAQVNRLLGYKAGADLLLEIDVDGPSISLVGTTSTEGLVELSSAHQSQLDRLVRDWLTNAANTEVTINHLRGVLARDPLSSDPDSLRDRGDFVNVVNRLTELLGHTTSEESGLGQLRRILIPDRDVESGR